MSKSSRQLHCFFPPSIFSLSSTGYLYQLKRWMFCVPSAVRWGRCAEMTALLPGCLRPNSRCFYARQLNAVEHGLRRSTCFNFTPAPVRCRHNQPARLKIICLSRQTMSGSIVPAGSPRWRVSEPSIWTQCGKVISSKVASALTVPSRRVSWKGNTVDWCGAVICLRSSSCPESRL